MTPLPLRRPGLLVGPIFGYELVRIARRGRYFLIRGVCACLLAGVVLAMHWGWSQGYDNGRVPPGAMSAFAEHVLVVFLGLQFALGVLLTPVYTASAVTDEKERNTLVFLLASDLRGYELVLGKFAARLTNVLLLLCVGLPILGLLELLGGVELAVVVSGFVALLAMVISLAALSILFSVYARRSRTAVIGTYLLILAYLFLSQLTYTLMFDVLRGQILDVELLRTDPPITFGSLIYAQAAGNPLILARMYAQEMAAGTPLGEVLWDLARHYAAFTLLVAAICLVWAILRVRAVGLRELSGANTGFRRGPRARPRWLSVGNRPLLWKELHTGRTTWRHSFGQFFVFVLALFTIALPLYVGLGHVSEISWWQGDKGFIAPMVAAVSWTAACCALLGVLLRAAGSVSGERDQQTMDCLLTTPNSAESILFAKWLGTLFGSRGVWLWLTVLWVEGYWLSGRALLNLPLLFLLWLVFAAFYAALGLWFSVVCRTSLRAMSAALLAGAAVTAGHWLLWIGYYPFVLMTAEPPQTVARLARWHVAFTPPMVLTVTGSSLTDLEQSVAEWVTSYLGVTPQALLAPLLGGVFGNGQGWLGVPAAPEEMRTILGLGLLGWLLAAAFLWQRTLVRFRALTLRTLVTEPDLETPGKENELELLRARQAAQQHSLRRRWAIALAGMAEILFFPFAAYWYLDWRATHTLRRAVAELTAAEAVWQLHDLDAARAVIPKEQNAAERVLAARALYPRNPMKSYRANNGEMKYISQVLGDVPRNIRLEPHVLTVLRASLQNFSAARAEALSLAEMPQGRYPIQWAPDYISTLLPHAQEARQLGFFAQDDVFLRLEEGDIQGACQCWRALLNIARSFGDEPILVSMLCRMQGGNVAVGALERILGQGEPSAADLADMQARLEQEADEPLLYHGLRGERACMNGLLDQLEHELTLAQMARRMGMARDPFPGFDWLNRASYKYTHAALLGYLTESVKIAALPAETWKPRFAEAEKHVSELPWLARLLGASPWKAKSFEAALHQQAALRCAIAALAAERFRQAEGRWPTTLEELVPHYLKSAPLDPYDSQPLRLVRRDGQLVIYALGKDDVDNGGDLNKLKNDDAPDVGFRLWDPPHRRLPPRNPELGPPWLPDDN